jgi:hypothetical protein
MEERKTIVRGTRKRFRGKLLFLGSFLLPRNRSPIVLIGKSLSFPSATFSKCPNSRVRRDALLTKEFWFSLDEVLLYRYLDREQFRATFFSIFHCQHGAGKFLCI